MIEGVEIREPSNQDNRGLSAHILRTSGIITRHREHRELGVKTSKRMMRNNEEKATRRKSELYSLLT